MKHLSAEIERAKIAREFYTDGLWAQTGLFSCIVGAIVALFVTGGVYFGLIKFKDIAKGILEPNLIAISKGLLILSRTNFLNAYYTAYKSEEYSTAFNFCIRISESFLDEGSLKDAKLWLEKADTARQQATRITLSKDDMKTIQMILLKLQKRGDTELQAMADNSFRQFNADEASGFQRPSPSVSQIPDQKHTARGRKRRKVPQR